MNEQPVELPSGRLPTILAVLAMAAGRPVPVERLATAVWGDDLSVDVRPNVQSNIRRLRRLLGPERILTHGHGYALDVQPHHVDAIWFVRLLDQATAAPDEVMQRNRLVEALDLWRGAPFDGLRSDWLEQTHAPRLEERYLTGLERRIDIDLTSGSLADLVAELGELTRRYPLRESLWVRLIAALQRSGRQAEALERYEAIRVLLADELGTDPGPGLQRVYNSLLAGEPLDLPGVPATPRAVPRQLPVDTALFSGRDAALNRMNALLDRDDSARRPPTVAAITGTAGVGKTALAIHWAHTVADQFPDGSLYTNLRGFDPAGTPVDPAEVARRFLDALGVSSQAIPTNTEAQFGLYRSMLAEKKVLIVLDNARDADQVTPLLPGETGCLVLVTSRNQLSGLAALGAHSIALDLLTPDEAVQMLALRLGQNRIAAEPEATHEFVMYCAHLPLALTIAAARAAANPEFPLGLFAEQLRQPATRLDELNGGDTATDTRAVFSWSYHNLDHDTACLFRLLGLHAGPDITVRAAASLTGQPVAQVRPALAQLVRAHLLVEPTPGRYTFHDLLRSYATELAEMLDSRAERRTAMSRLLDHYLHTAYGADRLLFPNGEPIDLDQPQPGVVIEDLEDHDQSMAWLIAERPSLLTLLDRAAHEGFYRRTYRLAWTLFVFLHRRGHWHDRAATQHAALTAAQGLGDLPAQARSHRYLGSAYADLGRYDDAHRHLRLALTLASDISDPAEQAWSHYYLNLLYGQQNRDRDALDSAEQALRLFRAAGDRTGQAIALTDVGWYQGRLGNHKEALELCTEAVDLHEELDNRPYQAHTWSCLGDIYQHAGDPDQAIQSFQRALHLFREFGDRFGEASALATLSELHRSTGNSDQADHIDQQAHAILDELDPATAEQIRARHHWVR